MASLRIKKKKIPHPIDGRFIRLNTPITLQAVHRAVVCHKFAYEPQMVVEGQGHFVKYL